MYTVVYSTVSTVVWSAVDSVVFNTVYTALSTTIYRKQGRGYPLGNKSSHPATLTFGYSLLYITVYTVQYSVHFTFQCSICMWGCLSTQWDVTIQPELVKKCSTWFLVLETLNSINVNSIFWVKKTIQLVPVDLEILVHFASIYCAVCSEWGCIFCTVQCNCGVKCVSIQCAVQCSAVSGPAVCSASAFSVQCSVQYITVCTVQCSVYCAGLLMCGIIQIIETD